MKTLLLVNVYLTVFVCAVAGEIDAQRFDQLDDSYQQLADEIYRSQGARSRSIDDIDQLWSEYQAHLSRKQSAAGHGLLLSNLTSMAAQSNSPLVRSIIQKLLKQNERQLAENIYGLIEATSGTGRQAYLDFEFAKYYADQRNWLQVNQLLREISVDLAKEDAEYAYLLQGLSLQFLKQHRLSIESYQSITETSPYFVHARLNTALANIRQGWAIEARAIITELIPISRDRNLTELTNRMFVVLGYALLQQEYFRDARDAFRRVESNSSYAARALFGIALSAISQGDLSGGLNAVNQLKQGQSQDLSRDEAYLLLPYIYDRLDQPLQVADSFNEAINHFQARLLELEAIALQSVEPENMQLRKSGKLMLGGRLFDYKSSYPAYLLTNRQNLQQLSEEIIDSAQLKKIQDLENQYDSLLTEITDSLVEEQIQIVKSYLNQARYGLARHYDRQNEAAQ